MQQKLPVVFQNTQYLATKPNISKSMKQFQVTTSLQIQLVHKFKSWWHPNRWKSGYHSQLLTLCCQPRLGSKVMFVKSVKSPDNGCVCKISEVGYKIVDHSDEVGASPVDAAPITSSFSTWHLASVDWAKTIARQHQKHLGFGIWCTLY